MTMSVSVKKFPMEDHDERNTRYTRCLLILFVFKLIETKFVQYCEKILLIATFL